MAKCLSKSTETRDKLSTTCNLKVMSRVFRYETKARKVMAYFKFNALYRYVSIESLLNPGRVKNLAKSLY